MKTPGTGRETLSLAAATTWVFGSGRYARRLGLRGLQS